MSGEDELSFAYDGRSKKVSGGKEEEYGEPFSEGDIIGCYAVSYYFSILVSSAGLFFLISILCPCLYLHTSSLFRQMVLLSSFSIRTAVSWALPIPLMPLCCGVVPCSLMYCVRASRSDCCWTLQLLNGTRAHQGLLRWQLSLLGKECAPHRLPPPERSRR